MLLVNVVHAEGPLAGIFAAAESREKDAGEDGDDRNDDEQFDQRKSVSIWVVNQRRILGSARHDDEYYAYGSDRSMGLIGDKARGVTGESVNRIASDVR